MCARLSAVLSVPEGRVRGIFEGRVRTILSKTDFNKKAIPIFLTSYGSDLASGYIRLGMGRWVNSSSLEVADWAGMDPDEYSRYCGRGNVMAFDIVEVVRLSISSCLPGSVSDPSAISVIPMSVSWRSCRELRTIHQFPR